MRNGRIISLSSCSTIWQCQTNWPGVVNCAPHAGYLARERDDRVLEAILPGRGQQRRRPRNNLEGLGVLVDGDRLPSGCFPQPAGTRLGVTVALVADTAGAVNMRDHGDGASVRAGRAGEGRVRVATAGAVSRITTLRRVCSVQRRVDGQQVREA